MQTCNFPHTQQILFLCETQVSNTRQFGSRKWADRNVYAVVAVIALLASTAAHACPARLRDSTNQQGRSGQHQAAHTFEWTANAATLKLAQTTTTTATITNTHNYHNHKQMQTTAHNYKPTHTHTPSTRTPAVRAAKAASPG